MWFKVFYCVAISMCLAHLMAEDIKESTGSDNQQEVPTTYRKLALSSNDFDASNTSNEIFEKNGDLDNSENKELGAQETKLDSDSVDWKTKYDDLMEDYMTYYYHVREKMANTREHLADLTEIINQEITSANKKSELISQAREQIERIRKELSFSSFLKPFAMISAAIISGTTLCYVAKKSFDYCKKYCAKQKQKQTTTIATQEITIFEV